MFTPFQLTLELFHLEQPTGLCIGPLIHLSSRLKFCISLKFELLLSPFFTLQELAVLFVALLGGVFVGLQLSPDFVRDTRVATLVSLL